MENLADSFHLKDGEGKKKNGKFGRLFPFKILRGDGMENLVDSPSHMFCKTPPGTFSTSPSNVFGTGPPAAFHFFPYPPATYLFFITTHSIPHQDLNGILLENCPIYPH